MQFEWSEEKNSWLKQNRQIGFEDVVKAITDGRVLDYLESPKDKYKHQYMLIFEKGGYAYVCPYVVDSQQDTLFLKTIYPDRKMTKKYII